MTDNKASSTETGEPRNWFTRFLDTVEWLGNLLPHPVTLFALLAIAMVLLSGLFGWLEARAARLHRSRSAGDA